MDRVLIGVMNELPVPFDPRGKTNSIRNQGHSVTQVRTYGAQRGDRTKGDSVMEALGSEVWSL